MDRQLDLSLLATIAAAVLAAVAGAAEWVRSIVNPEPRPGVLLFSLSIFVLLLTAVGLALVGSIVARLIASAGGFTAGFWPAAGLFLQDLALWLTIWIVMWGAPFAVAILLTGYFGQFLLMPVAVAIGIVLGIALLLSFKRWFSSDVWAVLARYWPARYVGGFWMVVAITALTFPGILILQRCHTLDVTGVAGVHKPEETLPVEVKISGRLVGHSRLRAALFRADSTAAQPIEVLRFRMEEPGTYVTWLSLVRLAPGPYRLKVFFDVSRLDGLDKSLAKSPIFRPAERQVLFQVTR